MPKLPGATDHTLDVSHYMNISSTQFIVHSRLYMLLFVLHVTALCFVFSVPLGGM